MRNRLIVLDLQGAQSASSWRGIGRYSLEFAKHLIANAPENKFAVIVNNSLTEKLKDFTDELAEINPKPSIVQWHPPFDNRLEHTNPVQARRIREIIREKVIRDLNPDLVISTNPFECGINTFSVPISSHAAQVGIFYDAIPLSQDGYAFTQALQEEQYLDQGRSLARCDLVIAISEFSKSQAVHYFNVAAEKVEICYPGVSPTFSGGPLTNETDGTKLTHLVGSENFILYAGGADPRKNLHRLVEAYCALEPNQIETYSLVLAGKEPRTLMKTWEGIAKKHGVAPSKIICTGFVPEEMLRQLYEKASLFVMPSLEEGFGLPVIEAMASGTPTICSKGSSLDEVIASSDMQFNPRSVESIRDLVKKTLSNGSFRSEIVRVGLEKSKSFDWNNSINTLLPKLSDLLLRQSKSGPNTSKQSSLESFRTSLIQLESFGELSEASFLSIAAAIDFAEISVDKFKQDVVPPNWQNPKDSNY